MMTRKSSSLSTYERLSPNKSSPRKQPIKRLTPHCMAGNLTIERCLGLSRFITPDSKKGVSCTYAIGSDGRIGLGVLETDRPWTSSSSYNDHQAITFEIANSGGAPNWPMTDSAINSFIALAVDICKFYGFKKVHYEEKPANVVTQTQVEAWIKTWEKSDEMIITLHRWYTAKACPGEYFVGKLPGIVNEINNRLVTPHVVEPFSPYQIKLTTKSVNIYKGPGTNNPIVMTLKDDPNVYTIIQEANGSGAKKWGKLKSGIGWISLDLTSIYKPKSTATPTPTPTPTPKPVFSPYQIKITVSALRVRSGPGAPDYPIVRTLRNDPNIYTITKESNGPGANKWGYLKSGLGWIALDFTKKV